MEKKNYTATIEVAKSAKDVFNDIKEVSKWWSKDYEGNSTNLNDEFVICHPGAHFSKQKLIEVIPDKKVVWFVVDNYFKFTQDKSEWTGTKIIFEISRKDNRTEVRFTHLGLVPEYECFDVCSNGWTHYIRQSLLGLIATGKGQPNKTGSPMTTDEEKLHSAAGKA